MGCAQHSRDVDPTLEKGKGTEYFALRRQQEIRGIRITRVFELVFSSLIAVSKSGFYTKGVDHSISRISCCLSSSMNNFNKQTTSNASKR